jgi:hypothetical protein
MEHPFISPAPEKSLEEIQTTISELNKKLGFAYRMGNSAMIHQIKMALESYQIQFKRRTDEVFEKQQISTKIDIQSSEKQK